MAKRKGAKMITVTTNKGGVLKTSLSTNLAGIYSQKGKVLVIDADNQGNVALSFGKNPDEYENTLYDVLVHGVDYGDAIYKVSKNIDILPSNDEMAFFDFDILTNIRNYPKPFDLMRENLEGVESFYDYILIDTPPNLGLVHGNVLCFSNDVLIPFLPEVYSMRSLVKIIKSIQQFKEQHNPNLNILGVVGTLVDTRTVLHSEIMQECRKYCHEHGIRIFETVIPKSIRFASSVAYAGLPAVMVDKKHELVKSYYNLEREIYNVEKDKSNVGRV